MTVETVDRLEQQHILDIVNGKLDAIRIKNFCSAEVCQEISEKVLNSSLYGRYVNAPKIGRVGQAFFESQACEKSKLQYAQKSVLWMKQLREECEPNLTPIDKIRLELDEAWEKGAIVHSLDGTKMFAGLVREFATGSCAEPHQDILSWDAKGVWDAEVVRSQVAINVYMRVPEEGGELVLWPRSLTAKEYETFQIPGSYGVRRDVLGSPSQVITPEAGELIMFNPRNVHAVDEIKKGLRVTWSMFAGIVSQDTPVVMWS